jgi:hypothetical protein
MPGRIEHDRAGDLHLAHGDLPPVARRAVFGAKRQGQPVQPPLGEHLNGARLQPVTDLMQGGRVIAGGEAVGQRSEPDPGLGGLPLGPFCPLTQILAGYGK